MDEIKTEIFRQTAANLLQAEVSATFSGERLWRFSSDGKPASPLEGLTDEQAVQYLDSMANCSRRQRLAYVAMVNSEGFMSAVVDGDVLLWRPAHDPFFPGDLIEEPLPVRRDFSRPAQGPELFLFDDEEQKGGAREEAAAVDRTSLESMAGAIERILGLPTGAHLKPFFLLIADGRLSRGAVLEILNSHLDALLAQISPR